MSNKVNQGHSFKFYRNHSKGVDMSDSMIEAFQKYINKKELFIHQSKTETCYLAYYS